MEHFEYPDVSTLSIRVQNAVNSCVRNNLISPLLRAVETTLGAEKFDKVYRSVVYSNIPNSDPLRHVVSVSALQQLIGSLLHHNIGISSLENCILETGMLTNSGTRVCRLPIPEGHWCVKVLHNVPYSTQLERYIQRVGDENLQVEEVLENGMCIVSWDLGYVNDSISSLEYTANAVPAAIKIYYKLLTRFDKWSTSQNTFPIFQR